MDLKHKIDQKLQEDIGKIKKEIFNNINSSNIISIFLYGGYGRDEGSWVIDKQEVKPYNDYDIAIMVKKRVSPKIINFIEQELKSKVEVKWIDICQYTKLRLNFFKVSIRNYDFKYASKCIFGDEKFMRHIPSMEAQSIPLKDIETLYKTRIWTLVGSFPVSGLREMSKEDEMLFRNQMAKCVLAIVDCVLVLKNKYHPSYVERTRIFGSEMKNKELIKLSKWALNEKLRPKSPGMKQEDIIKKYFTIRSYFFKYFFLGLSKYYGTKIKIPNDLNNFILYNPLNLVKENIKYFLLGNSRDKLQKHLTIAQGYMAYYYPDIPNNLVLEIKNIMNKKFKYNSTNIEEIRLKIADLRVNI